MKLASLALVALAGCVTVIDGESSSTSSASTSADAGAGSALSPGETAVARGMEWVVAMVPYCQAANHQTDDDSACASTCERPDNPAWDAYRSDCSGFVSWSWGLAPPGHTTATLAPFDASVSTAIEATQLQSGDAINNDTHTMLFVAWNTDMTEATFMEEPGCSASPPYAREVTVGVTLSGQSVTVDGYGTFTAIRQK